MSYPVKIIVRTENGVPLEITGAITGVVDTGLNPLTDAQLRASPVPVETQALNYLTDSVTVYGVTAANAVIPQNQSALVTREIDMETQVAHGLLTGFSIVNKYGVNRDVDTTTTPEDVWGGSGPYMGFPTQLETLTITSTSANDAIAGTGARTLRVVGLDSNYNVLQEDINLNGIAGATSINQFRRVHTAYVIAAGSGGVNAGVINVQHTTTTANLFLSMAIGINQTNCSAYTIPAGYTGYLRRLMITPRVISTGGSGSLEGSIWTRTFGQVFRARRPFFLSSNSEYVDQVYGGLVFTEKTDLVIRIATVSDNNSIVTASYDMLLVKNA